MNKDSPGKRVYLSYRLPWDPYSVPCTSDSNRPRLTDMLRMYYCGFRPTITPQPLAESHLLNDDLRASTRLGKAIRPPVEDADDRRWISEDSGEATVLAELPPLVPEGLGTNIGSARTGKLKLRSPSPDKFWPNSVAPGRRVGRCSLGEISNSS